MAGRYSNATDSDHLQALKVILQVLGTKVLTIVLVFGMVCMSMRFFKKFSSPKKGLGVSFSAALFIRGLYMSYKWLESVF